jgi:AraC-like DNA-binding protein
MDPLSDVLRIVRLKGGVFLHAEFTAPWCVPSQLRPGDLGKLLEEPEHLILYHYVVEGRMAVQLGGTCIEIDAGEAVIFPHNDEHLLANDASLTAAPCTEVERSVRPDGLRVVRLGGGGARTQVICGYLGCDKLDGNPLAAALPPVLRYDTRQGGAAAWIKSSLDFAVREVEMQGLGSGTVLARISELLFVEALRRYVEGLPEEQSGWLAGLKDRYVARALALLHGQVARQWTVDDLAREVGLSRSALGDRFTRLIGEPPMRYLARWRIQVAAHHLRDSDAPLARIAELVGYESETAFNRAFKRGFGVPPATWRKDTAVAESTAVVSG